MLNTKPTVTNLIQASKALLDKLKTIPSSPEYENNEVRPENLGIEEKYIEDEGNPILNDKQIEFQTKEQERSLRILNEILNSKYERQGYRKGIVKKLDFNKLAVNISPLDNNMCLKELEDNDKVSNERLLIMKQFDDLKSEIEENEQAITKNKEDGKNREIIKAAFFQNQQEQIENCVLVVKQMEKELFQLREKKRNWDSKLQSRPLRMITENLKQKKEKMEKMRAELQKLQVDDEFDGEILHEEISSLQIKMRNAEKDVADMEVALKDVTTKLDQRYELKAMTKEEIRAKLLIRSDLQQQKKMLEEENRELGKKFKEEWDLCQKEKHLLLDINELEEKSAYLKIERKNLLAKQAKVLLDYESKRERIEIIVDDVKKILNESVFKLREVITEKNALYQLLGSSALGKRKSEIKNLFENFVDQFKSRFDSISIVKQLDIIEREEGKQIRPSLDSLKQKWRAEVSCYISTSPQPLLQDPNESDSLTDSFYSRLKEFPEISTDTKEMLFSALTVTLGFEEQSYLLIRERNETILAKIYQINQQQALLSRVEQEKNLISIDSEKLGKNYEQLLTELRIRKQQYAQIGQILEKDSLYQAESVFTQYLENQVETFRTLQRTYGKKAADKLRREHQIQFIDLMKKNQSSRLEKIRSFDDSKKRIDLAIRQNINDVDIKLNNNLVLTCNEIHLLSEESKAIEARLEELKYFCSEIKKSLQLNKQDALNESALSFNDRETHLNEKTALIKRKINIIADEIIKLENEIIETDKQSLEIDEREKQIIDTLQEKKEFINQMIKANDNNKASYQKEDLEVQNLNQLYMRKYLLQEKKQGLQFKMNEISDKTFEEIKSKNLNPKINSVSYRNPAEKPFTVSDLDKRSFSISFTKLESDQCSNSTDITSLSQNKFFFKESNSAKIIKSEKTPKFNLNLQQKNPDQSRSPNKIRERSASPLLGNKNQYQLGNNIRKKEKTATKDTISSRAKSRSKSFDIANPSEKCLRDDFRAPNENNSFTSTKFLNHSRDNSLNKSCMNSSFEKKRKPKVLFECRPDSANSKEIKIFNKIKPLLEGCSFYVRNKKDVAQEFENVLSYLQKSDLNHPGDIGFSLRTGSLHRCLKKLEFKHTLRPNLDLGIKVDDILKLRVLNPSWRGISKEKYFHLGICSVGGFRLDILFDKEEIYDKWNQGLKELRDNSSLLLSLSKKLEAYYV